MPERLSKRRPVRVSSKRLREIFERYFEPVYAYVAYRVAPDFDAARDITHETFLACFEGLSNYRGEASLLRWLRAIARNKVIDHIRSVSGKGTREIGEAALDKLQVENSRASYEARERTVLVGAVMRRLPQHYAEVLDAQYPAGLSVEHTARQRNNTAKAIESTLSRARNAFRTAYDELNRKRKVKP